MQSLQEFLVKEGIESSRLESDILILTSSDEEAAKISSYLKFFSPNLSFYFPSLDSLPYDRVSPSNKILSQRANILSVLASSSHKKIIVTNSSNLLMRMENPKFYKDASITLKRGAAQSSKDLESFLIKYGYSRQAAAIDCGDYSMRGDIIDVVLFAGDAFRISFDWEKIEKIKKFDPETQISTEEVQSIEISLCSELILNGKTAENFRRNFLASFGVQKSNEAFFLKTMELIKVPGIENISPAFYEEACSFIDYFGSFKIYKTLLVENSIREFENQITDFYNARLTSNSFYPAFKPEIIYEKSEVLLQKLSKLEQIEFSSGNLYSSSMPNFAHISKLENMNMTPVQLFAGFLREKKPKITCIFYSCHSYLERIKYLLKLENLAFYEIKNFQHLKAGAINLAYLDFDYGFYNPEYAFISDKEILLDRKNIKQTSKRRLKNIFRELESFSEGDLVVHVDHGIGKYEAIEQIEINNIRHDCLKLIYARGDKLFIPVENIDLIKKYGDEYTELDYLGSASWQRRKSKLKDRIGILAKILMDNAAARLLNKAQPTNYDKEQYDKFCNNFSFNETEDQIRAIDDIITDLCEDKLMDRLICGDVGFGKTEVAMRAAFIVGQEKQVAVIVPTTILCRQHYNNFLERFRGFNYKIKQLSRFVSSQEATKIREEVKRGEVDIVIGTHALLSDNIKFKDLGLIIIDEEQHFGVNQKEKLKLVSSTTHALTLSATPIPRTLQMSLIGIRDLSLIATPPIDRLSVKTNVISFDDVIIREAILREKFRGGKTFFVCPRISDIKDISEKLKALIPEVKISEAHGKLSPSSIDQIMTDFYEGKFDVLLSTAIVESGLDIPSANTIIIFKAEMFGLSQLYQLRGRVGRGKSRGYTYLVTDNKKLPSKSAIKRLEILEAIDSLGAGFSIASHDMDIRGFGNIVGDEQSGHIKEVGVELYQEMLEEAINNHKNQGHISANYMPDVRVNIPIFIPENYISDSSLRLSIYRRIGDLRTQNEIDELKDELIDRFGHFSDTVENLLDIISLKILCKSLNIKTLEIGSSGIGLEFSEQVDPSKVMLFIAKYNKSIKLKPGNKIAYSKKMNNEIYLQEGRKLLNELAAL